MSTFRKLPSDVEAWRYWPGPMQTTYDLDGEGVYLLVGGKVKAELPNNALNLWVEKSQAWCLVTPGDYIIEEADGSGFYPCIAEVFEKSYAHLTD